MRSSPDFVTATCYDLAETRTVAQWSMRKVAKLLGVPLDEYVQIEAGHPADHHVPHVVAYNHRLQDLWLAEAQLLLVAGRDPAVRLRAVIESAKAAVDAVRAVLDEA